jgi:hypothetical protein
VSSFRHQPDCIIRFLWNLRTKWKSRILKNFSADTQAFAIPFKPEQSIEEVSRSSLLNSDEPET